VSDREHDGNGASDFEELGDDIIIAQETAAHVPRPATNVSTDHPTVVISPSASQPPAARRVSTLPPFARDRTEKTVVIRDRKSLDKIRRQASRRPRARYAPRSRTLYLVGAAVLASLAAGTLLATLANSSSTSSEPSPAVSVDTEEPVAAPAASRSTPAVVDLEDLPVVKQKKKKKSSSGE
jgi:hypothetical protein